MKGGSDSVYYPSVLVVSSCTGVKLHKPTNRLTLTDFQAGDEHLKAREAELELFRDTALEMYVGLQHQQVKAGYNLLKNKEELSVSLEIISAGYGLVSAERVIAPYEMTFNNLHPREILSWSEQLKVHQDLNERIKNHDLIILLLGENYLKSAGLPLTTRANQSLIFLASGKSAADLPQHQAKQGVMSLVNTDAKRFGYGLVGLKGYLFHQLAKMVAHNPELLWDWYQRPQSAVTALNKWREQNKGVVEPVVVRPPKKTKVYKSEKAVYNPQGLSSEEFYPRSQHLRKMPTNTRFTLVVNNQDKLKITRSECGELRTTPLIDRIWNYIEGLGTPPGPRGFLTSLAYHAPDGDPLPFWREGNIYDCGAWSYRGEVAPILSKRDGPLTPESVMKLFERSGVRRGTDIIISPDMLVMDDDTPERTKQKIGISLDFADKIRPLSEGHRVMAVTHGDFEQRHEMMDRYLDMGYTHIGLGSLAIKSSRDPHFIYQCILDALSYRKQFPDLYIHVLGVSSISWAATLTHLGVDSFDGSSMYMSAFTGGTFLRYIPDSPQLLHGYRVVNSKPWSNDLPPCDCPACQVVRGEGWDTRAQGGRKGDPNRPYNGGNEANMGRAIHNINMYLRALQDVQARVLSGDQSLLIKQVAHQRVEQRKAILEQLSGG